MQESELLGSISTRLSCGGKHGYDTIQEFNVD